jgi:cytochrome P450
LAIGAALRSVLTTNHLLKAKDESWSRQRRIVAPALNERISPNVWRESVEQASSLADLLISSSQYHSIKEAAQVIPGLRTIAMNVLARIAYGHHKPFRILPPLRDPSTDMSYVDAISLCTEQLIAAAFLPISLLRLPLMPLVLQTLGSALKELPSLTRDMIDQERQKSNSIAPAVVQTTVNPGSNPNTIMSTLVRLSDQAKDQTDDKASTLSKKEKPSNQGSSTGKTYLTEDEIAGNLFIFTAAGFDTTANTMSYAVTLLAAYPEWQAWIQTEIDDVLGVFPGKVGNRASLPDYETAFPRLTRCLAVMVSHDQSPHVLLVCFQGCV